MKPASPSPAAGSVAAGDVPRPWTNHVLNTGAVFEATCIGVSLLPRWLSYGLGGVGAWLAWRAMPTMRLAVADNLRAVFPGESATALERRALRTIRAYTRDVIDFLSAMKVQADAAPAIFDYDPQHLRLFEELLARGKGVVLASGHYGNWELGSVAMRHVFRMPLSIVAMPEASETINQRRRQFRDLLGVDTIEVGRSLDTALQVRKRLGENRTVALLIDRHVGRDRVAVNFLGRQAWFLRTPALMASLSGAPLVPCFIERTDEGRHRIGPGEPIYVSTGMPRDAAIQHATQQVADQLAARVRRHPEYWYQFYSYWDAQQDATASAAPERR